MRSAELFAGCGGLALGLSRAGFDHALMAEFDPDAVATAQHNKQRGVKHVAHWPVERADVRDIDWEPLRGQLAVISGGPPCQPFGIGGKKQGPDDACDVVPCFWHAHSGSNERREPVTGQRFEYNLAVPRESPVC